MAYAFILARRGPRRGGGWLAASAAAHVAVIAAIFSAAPRFGAPTHTRKALTEHVVFVAPSAHLALPAMVPHVVAAAARGIARHPRALRRASDGRPAELSLARLDELVANLSPIAPTDSVRAADPSPDLSTLASDAIDFGGTAAQFMAQVMGRAYALANPNAIYDENAVDEIAEAMRENPKPVYPFALRMAGVEDSFIVRFVVDTTGRVDEKSLEFPEKAQRLLVASVRDALRHSRYFPAVLGGQRVSQLVAQRFSFVLQR